MSTVNLSFLRLITLYSFDVSGVNLNVPPNQKNYLAGSFEQAVKLAGFDDPELHGWSRQEKSFNKFNTIEVEVGPRAGSKQSNSRKFQLEFIEIDGKLYYIIRTWLIRIFPTSGPELYRVDYEPEARVINDVPVTRTTPAGADSMDSEYEVQWKEAQVPDFAQVLVIFNALINE